MVFIPWVIAGAGAALLAWGSEMIYNDDDSADKQVAKFIRNLPEYVKKHVQRVEYNGNGFTIYWKSYLTTGEIKRLEEDIS